MSQTSEILAYLQNGKTLSPVEALNLFGCFRLGARVFELRREGYNIVDVGDSNYSVYKLLSVGGEIGITPGLNPAVLGSSPSQHTISEPTPSPKTVFFDRKGQSHMDLSQ